MPAVRTLTFAAAALTSLVVSAPAIAQTTNCIASFTLSEGATTLGSLRARAGQPCQLAIVLPGNSEFIGMRIARQAREGVVGVAGRTRVAFDPGRGGPRRDSFRLELRYMRFNQPQVAWVEFEISVE